MPLPSPNPTLPHRQRQHGKNSKTWTFSTKSTITVQIPLESVGAFWQGVRNILNQITAQSFRVYVRPLPHTHAGSHCPAPARQAHCRNLPARSALPRPWLPGSHSAVAPDIQRWLLQPRNWEEGNPPHIEHREKSVFIARIQGVRYCPEIRHAFCPSPFLSLTSLITCS